MFPHSIPRRSATSDTKKRRARRDRTEPTHKVENRANLASVDRKPGERQPAEPQPLFYIAASHHPSIRGRSTQSVRDKVLLGAAAARLLPVSHHHTFDSLHCARAGGFQGAGAAGSVDPTDCAEDSDESSGPVHSPMEPQ